jgi:hypothetical protein
MSICLIFFLFNILIATLCPVRTCSATFTCMIMRKASPSANYYTSWIYTETTLWCFEGQHFLKTIRFEVQLRQEKSGLDRNKRWCRVPCQKSQCRAFFQVGSLKGKSRPPERHDQAYRADHHHKVDSQHQDASVRPSFHVSKAALSFTSVIDAARELDPTPRYLTR